MENSVRTVAVDDFAYDIGVERLLYSLVGSGIDESILVEIRLSLSSKPMPSI